jgi:hypothetical protein
MAYDIDGDGLNYEAVRDILHRVRFREVVKNNSLILYPYTVKDGETPEIIAHKLYGSSLYHWIVLFANDIYNLWDDWPMSYASFIEYLTKVYGSPDTAMATTHHYEDVDGNWIDLTTYNATIADGSKAIDAYTYENDLNEAKKEIRLLDAKFITLVSRELDSLLVPTV